MKVDRIGRETIQRPDLGQYEWSWAGDGTLWVKCPKKNGEKSLRTADEIERDYFALKSIKVLEERKRKEEEEEPIWPGGEEQEEEVQGSEGGPAEEAVESEEEEANAERKIYEGQSGSDYPAGKEIAAPEDEEAEEAADENMPAVAKEEENESEGPAGNRAEIEVTSEALGETGASNSAGNGQLEYRGCKFWKQLRGQSNRKGQTLPGRPVLACIACDKWTSKEQTFDNGEWSYINHLNASADAERPYLGTKDWQYAVHPLEEWLIQVGVREPNRAAETITAADLEKQGFKVPEAAQKKAKPNPKPAPPGPPPAMPAGAPRPSRAVHLQGQGQQQQQPKKATQAERDAYKEWERERDQYDEYWGHDQHRPRPRSSSGGDQQRRWGAGQASSSSSNKYLERSAGYQGHQGRWSRRRDSSAGSGGGAPGWMKDKEIQKKKEEKAARQQYGGRKAW